MHTRQGKVRSLDEDLQFYENQLERKDGHLKELQENKKDVGNANEED